MTAEMTAFRDSQVVVIDTDRTLIKAGLGLHELLRAPTVEVLARVGLRKEHGSVNGLNGSEHHQAIVASNGITNGSTSNSMANNQGHSYKPKPKASEYLVGHVLDEALAAGVDIDVFWPFKSGKIGDWAQAEALWKYVLFHKLSLRRTQNESPVLLSIPSSLSRRTHERLTQLFFERLNVPAFSLLERPLCQLYAANSISGVVVNIDRSTIDITPIVDTAIQHSSRITLGIGVEDCEVHLANVLRNNQSLVNAVSPLEAPLSTEALSEALLSVAREVLQAGLVKVPLESEREPEDEGITDIAAVLVAGKERAIIESSLKRKATVRSNAAERERAREIEAMDLVQMQWQDRVLTLGKERHRFCEPLFDALFQIRHSDSGPLVLQEAVHLAVRGVDIDYRTKIWDGVFVTGEITALVKGIGAALQSHLSAYILSSPDILSDVQPKFIRCLKVPEYYPNFREKGDSLASFLGASIVAKTMFSDPTGQTFVSKSDYSRIGPKAIVDLVPTVL